MEESSSEVVYGCVLAVVAVVAGCVLNGFVLATLWGWFVVPVFHLVALGPAQAIGIMFMVRLFHGTSSSSKDEDESFGKALTTLVVRSVVSPLISLGLGWVLRGFL